MPARRRHRGRAEFHRHRVEPLEVAADRPAGFGLPPVIDHRHAQQLLRPFDRRRIATFAGEEQRAELREVVLLQQLTFGVLALDRAEGGRRGEQRHRLVLGDHAPEGAGIRRADRLSFVEDRGRAVDERPIDDVAVAHDPAHVRGAPVHFARLDAVEVLHRPGERHAVAAGVAHDTLGLPGRARRVEDVERIGGLHRHARRRLCRGERLVPVEVATGHHRRGILRPLQQDNLRHLVSRLLDRLIDQRLVLHDARRLDPARGGQDQLGRAIVDAARQFLGREAAEHHGMDGTDPSAGEHRHNGFGDHRHVEDDTVALAHALGRDHAGDERDLIAQLAIGEGLLGVGERRVVDQRRLLGAATVDMPVERIVAGI